MGAPYLDAMAAWDRRCEVGHAAEAMQHEAEAMLAEVVRDLRAIWRPGADIEAGIEAVRKRWHLEHGREFSLEFDNGFGLDPDAPAPTTEAEFRAIMLAECCGLVFEGGDNCDRIDAETAQIFEHVWPLG